MYKFKPKLMEKKMLLKEYASLNSDVDIFDIYYLGVGNWY